MSQYLEFFFTGIIVRFLVRFRYFDYIKGRVRKEDFTFLEKVI